MKQEFIKKWSNWWMLQKQGKELTEAFEKELDAIIKYEVAKNISFKPMLADSCQTCGHSPCLCRVPFGNFR